MNYFSLKKTPLPKGLWEPLGTPAQGDISREEGTRDFSGVSQHKRTNLKPSQRPSAWAGPGTRALGCKNRDTEGLPLQVPPLSLRYGIFQVGSCHLVKPHPPHKLDLLLLRGQALQSTRKDALVKFSMSGSHRFHERANAAKNKVTPKNETCGEQRALPPRLGSGPLVEVERRWR